MQLHTIEGARKYLTAGERTAFLQAAELADHRAVPVPLPFPPFIAADTRHRPE